MTEDNYHPIHIRVDDDSGNILVQCGICGYPKIILPPEVKPKLGKIMQSLFDILLNYNEYHRENKDDSQN